MVLQSLRVIIILLSALLVVSCSSGTVPPTSAPTSAPVPTTAPAQAVVASSQATAPTIPATAAATTAPTQPPKITVPSTSAAAGPTSKPGTFGKADLDKIFPPGKGQDLVFRACVNCHNWVPLVLAGFDPPAWDQNMMNHRNRVSGLTDDEFNELYAYLKGNFYPGKPVPTNIPKDLLDSWTSY